MITVKELTNPKGNRIYSPEAIDIATQKKSAGQMTVGSEKQSGQVPIADSQKPAGQLTVDKQSSLQQVPIADFNTKIRTLLEKAKQKGKQLSDSEGNVYGFVADGKIYLDPAKLTPELIAEEFTHLQQQGLRLAAKQGNRQARRIVSKWEKAVEPVAEAFMKGDKTLLKELGIKEGEMDADVYKQQKGESDAAYRDRVIDELWAKAQKEEFATHLENLANEGKLSRIGREIYDALKDFAAYVGEKLGLYEGKEWHDMTLPELIKETNKVISGNKFLKTKANEKRTGGLTRTQFSMLEKSDFDKDGNVKPEVAEAIKKEYADIEAKAKANGTWKKAPNGKESKLTDEQWVAVRSERFKKWFGDWEEGGKLQMIENATPTPIKPNSFSVGKIKSIYDSLKNGENKYDNRKVRFVNSTLGKILRHKGFDAKQIVPQLKEIFDNSIPIISEKEEAREGHKEHTNFSGYHHYLGKIKVGGKEMYVRFTVQELTPSWKKGEKTGESQFHNTAVSDVSIYSKSDPSVTTKDYSIGNDNRNRFIDTKLQNFFKKAKEAREGSSKVVDENGEPMVVYHGTDAKFNEFDKNAKSSNGTYLRDGRQGFFFANKEQAETYGRDVVPVFLNAKKAEVVDVLHELSQLDYDYKTERREAEDAGYPISRWLGERKESFEANDSATAYFDDNAAGIYDNAKTNNRDGIIVYGADGSVTAIAFEPNQIKSATGNVGTFSGKRNHIRFQASEKEGSQGKSVDKKEIEAKFREQLTYNYDAKKKEYKKEFGNVINTDNARTLSEDYNKNPAEMVGVVHKPASDFAKRMFDDAVKEEPKSGYAVFTAGGTGAGKSTALKGVGAEKTVKNADFVFDSNLDNYADAKEKINKTLKSGRAVDIYFTYRDKVGSFEDGVIPRMKETGRPLPIDYHLDKHDNALRTIKKLQNHYKNYPQVTINVIDNSLGAGNQRKSSLGIISKKHSFDNNETRKRLNETVEQQFRAGEITAEQKETLTQRAEPTGGRGNAGQPSQPGVSRKDNLSPKQQQRSGTPPKIATTLEEAKKKPVSVRDIGKFISTVFNVPVRRGLMGRVSKNIMGFYRTIPEVIRLRNSDDITTLMHETAHHLDKLFLKKNFPKELISELEALDYDKKKRRPGEGFAEFVRKWMTEDGDLSKEAPKTLDWWNNDLMKRKDGPGKQLEQIKQYVDIWRRQGAMNRVLGNIADVGEDNTQYVALSDTIPLSV